MTQSRLERAQTLMAQHGLAALLLTTEPEIRYFTGFLTRFWESPTRPWFLIVPASGDVIAVIPSIGEPLMARAGVSDIRTWRSPDLHDDGIGLLIETLSEVAPGQIGLPDGHETHVRMPLASLDQLRKAVSIRSDHGILRRLRLIKEEKEIDLIRTSCQIAGRAFARVPEIATAGMPLDQVFRNFQQLCLEEGADAVPYLAGAAGPGGYADVISPASPSPLKTGDVLMLDTGVIRSGYFADFNRNYAVGPASQDMTNTHLKLLAAIDAAMEVARPGRTASDLFATMDNILTGGNGGSDAGRYGHGLGMQLTEWPSLIPQDNTRLEPGMVLTLEPSVQTATGSMMVHEENIVIRDGPPERLSPFAARELVSI